MNNYDLTFESFKSIVWILIMIAICSYLCLIRIIRSWIYSVSHSSKIYWENMGCCSVWNLICTSLCFDILAIASRAGILSTSCFVSHKIVWNLIPDLYIWLWQSTTKREAEERLTEVCFQVFTCINGCCSWSFVSILWIINKIFWKWISGCIANILL